MSCGQTPPEYFQQHDNAPHILKVADIPLPEGYKRVVAGNNSFVTYSRNITLKPDNIVYLFNGVKKGNQSAQYAVLNIDVGNKDLQHVRSLD